MNAKVRIIGEIGKGYFEIRPKMRKFVPKLIIRMNKKRFSLSLIGIFCVCLSLLAQSTNQAYWSYIDKYKGWAMEQMKTYRIPASITLAQGLLESNAGRSTLATQANNHFGIKVGGNWTGPYMVKSDDRPDDRFRKYNNAYESFVDHSKFLQGRRYQGLFQLSPTDYRGWAKGLKAAGYATNPAYAESLIHIIEMYNLAQFDNAANLNQYRVQQGAGDDFFARHTVYKNNKNYFIIVELGDDMVTISKKTGVSLKHLYAYNDLPKDYGPTQGDVLYLKKKQKCASKEFKKNPIHIVEHNQSMFDIAQLYGMRLENLYKLNKLDYSYSPKVGDILRIR